MNKVLITNYTSDTTDTTDVHICVQNDALLMHEKTPREVTRSQCSLPIVLYVTYTGLRQLCSRKPQLAKRNVDHAETNPNSRSATDRNVSPEFAWAE